MLESQKITLTVFRDTACRWMHLYGADTSHISKNYYNNLHHDDAVVK